jgi:2',3'-cyclic-nucleotide 2'-phosphodiesterase (5'-nucleotidase family)
MTGYTVVPALAQIETIMPRLMAKKPDMIILALHQGYIESDPRGVNEVAAIARGFPQIDLILCGHTHREIPGRRIGRSWVVQAGQHAQYLAKVTARIDTDRHRVTAIESELIPAAGESRDPEALTAVQAAVDAAAEYRRRKVCAVTNKISSGGMPGVDCHMSEVIARAIAWKTGAEVVFHGKLSTTSWPAGSDLTEGLLFDAVPYANGIGVADLTRDEIAEILEEQLQTRTRRAYNGLWGVQARADKKTGRVIDLKVPPGKRLTVAFNRYAIAGGGGRFPRLREILRRPGSRLRDAGVNSRDVLREYVRTVKGWDAPPHVWITFER